MYLEYFDKFYGMTPYLFIGNEEWEYIKKTFDREDVKESLAKVAATYEIPYAPISEEELKKNEEAKDKTFCEPVWIWKKL